jgi:fructose-bisphosphate aldolase class I
MDGSHDINVCARVSEHVYATVAKALHDNGVVLEGALLKPNMIAPGDAAEKVTPELIAEYTVRTLARTIPPAMTGIMVFTLVVMILTKSVLVWWTNRSRGDR